jgi:hypothetical protein
MLVRSLVLDCYWVCLMLGIVRNLSGFVEHIVVNTCCNIEEIEFVRLV